MFLLKASGRSTSKNTCGSSSSSPNWRLLSKGALRFLLTRNLEFAHGAGHPLTEGKVVDAAIHNQEGPAVHTDHLAGNHAGLRPDEDDTGRSAFLIRAGGGEGSFTDEELNNLGHELGTDRHILVQYGDWLWGLCSRETWARRYSMAPPLPASWGPGFRLPSNLQ